MSFALRKLARYVADKGHEGARSRSERPQSERPHGLAGDRSTSLLSSPQNNTGRVMPVQWYCRLMGAEMGPFTAAQLVEMAQSHQLTPEDLVRRGPDGEWVPGYRVRGLFDDQARTRTVAATPPAAAPKAPKRAPAPAADHSAAAGEEVGWFYISQGTKYGPLAFETLQQRSRSGQLRPTDRVWSTLTPKWSEARNVDGLEFD